MPCRTKQHHPLRPGLFAFAAVFFLLWLGVCGKAPAGEAEKTADADAVRFRQWVEEMKTRERGPFKQIRRFCNDGAILPPVEGACDEHGGGWEHGEWSTQTLALRNAGFLVANILAILKTEQFTGPDADIDGFKQILMEKFLAGVDDGWVLRQTRTYRGAFQAEDEENASRLLQTAFLTDPLWLAPPRYFLLREAARLLPKLVETKGGEDVRELAIQIQDKDPEFKPIRAKIHNSPDRTDAAAVRKYAKELGKPELRKEYRKLAQEIDDLYAAHTLLRSLAALGEATRGEAVGGAVSETLEALKQTKAPRERMRLAARLLGRLRDALPGLQDPATRLLAVQASLALEQEAAASGNALASAIPKQSRRELLAWLADLSPALYGAGLISRREAEAVGQRLSRLSAAGGMSGTDYRHDILWLARLPGWAARNLSFHFGRAEEHFAVIESKARLYSQERLRGSPLLFAGKVLDQLARDANRLARLEHRFFGAPRGSGLRALNPGLARGVLREPGEDGRITDRNGIYLLPETTAELPPIAGILTLGEGNALSHVQLLARNLGIPNVVVSKELAAQARKLLGRRVFLGVSGDGVVELAEDGPQFDGFFKQQETEGPAARSIRVDVEKLDLAARALIPLDKLRATDSGRISGPKSANLGELRHAFGPVVPDGLVIPFGMFRELLERPIEHGGKAVFPWMQTFYQDLARLPAKSTERPARIAAGLKKLRGWFETVELGEGFRSQLTSSLKEHFGPDGSYGVFVRSDTNVEDLPGFSGAGLNLTVPNVVGEEAIIKAIRAVWASPFTDRSFAWRQSHMENPEYVFPAVLLQVGFNGEKSGVMVTKDMEWDRPGWVTVAVSEGVGGAVDGQAAESLRVRPDSGEVELLSCASAPLRRQLEPKGGLMKLPATGNDTLLQPEEIAQLVRLAREIPEKFPSLAGAPADVEFAFRDGKLALLQLRPLAEGRGTLKGGFQPERATTSAAGSVDLDAVAGVTAEGQRKGP